ncbi:MAG: cation-transporting P-type ATPase [Alphaproteobacteria bacterium]|nr:cation-transporting P-type ATPase [Alphaproteobacteria bacterium]
MATTMNCWHAAAADTCLNDLQSSLAGLSMSEAKARLDRNGPNELTASKRLPVAMLLLRQFRSPLIYLLLAAAAVSLTLGHSTDAAFIGAVLVINAVIGTTQEYRAETSMAALQKLIRQSAQVRRDGVSSLVDAREVVVGDVVEVESGMAVSADLRLLSSSALLVDESSLSGESLPVSKAEVGVLPVSSGLGDRANMLHAGTVIAEGRGAGVVVATGSGTQLGAIGVSLQSSTATQPPLVLRLQILARQIAIATAVLISALAILLVLTGEPAGQILLLAVALAVSAIPEGLPIAVTVALAAGTRRMAARQVIVRSLPAVEGLGACTLIASDKTGTLTQNRLTVERILLGSGEPLDRDAWLAPVNRECQAELARAAMLCNEASLDAAGVAMGDTVDIALLEFAREAGQDIDEIRRIPRVAAIPYEPARKFASVTIDVGGKLRVYIKGAPEVVLPLCDDADPATAAKADALAAAGFRVLAVVAGEVQTPTPGEAPSRITLLGCVALLDPIRPEVPAAIARCAEAGIAVRMITGDHPGTALTIARDLGLAAEPHQVVTGSQIAELAEQPEQLNELILGGRIFARIEPMQKLRIVEILSASGELVAVTGDGVNDAPALQAAHIGVAMGKAGTDVARGAADLVLADDNFASIIAGVEEGRITYANVRKIVIFVMASGIAEIAMFIGAVATGLPMPLTAIQLLWLNLVTNGAQDVMLGFGRGEGDELRHSPRPPSEALLDRRAIALMVPPALTMTVAALVLTSWLLERGFELAAVQNAVLLLTVLFQNVYVLCMRSERRPLYRERLLSNPLLLLGIGLAVGLQLLAMNWAPLANILGTSPVDQQTLIFCLCAAAGIIVVTEVTKGAVASIFADAAGTRRSCRPVECRVL